MIRNRPGLSTRATALIIFIGLYIIGIGYFMSLAETSTMNPITFWNRTHLYVLVGGILIGIYTWMNFKPKGLSTRHYIYHPWDHEDIPDSMLGNLSWGWRYVNSTRARRVRSPPSLPKSSG